MGCPTVMEFTGTQDGLQLAGDLVRAHGRLGIGGYHNDGPRSINYMLWNFQSHHYNQLPRTAHFLRSAPLPEMY